ncbi:MAG: hypothetical protein M1827_000876 [Pycnora praestabilis]|nr:MAG: hypothetical protein M1827_000876 [Pycnora praestabilis]
MPAGNSSMAEPSTANRNPFTAEGMALTARLYNYFYHANSNLFAARVPSVETVPPENGYVVWPVTLAVESLIEAERAAPGQYRTQLNNAMSALEKYHNPTNGAYCAWHYYQGNDDMYFDDNAQIAIAQIAAYQLTNNQIYLQRAIGVVRFLHTGWDNSSNPGGVRWHYRTSGPPYTGRNACSTSLTAVASLRLAAIPNIDSTLRQNCIIIATNATLWLIERLRDPGDGLIMDGLSNQTGTWIVSNTKWTYNSGNTLLAICLLAQFNPPGFNAPLKAYELAIPAIDRTKALYDLSVTDQTNRYWRDSAFFTHHLVEGLVTYLQTFDDPKWGQQRLDPGVVDMVKKEVNREMGYMIHYIRDPMDGLSHLPSAVAVTQRTFAWRKIREDLGILRKHYRYFRNLRLYVISPQTLAAYKSLTDDTARHLEPDASERANSDRPVEERMLVKTLLGSAGAARALLLAGGAGL